MELHYDGSFAGLLTALARLFTSGEEPAAILTGKMPQPGLFAEPAAVATDPEQAAAFLATIELRLGPAAARRILLAHASERPEAPLAIYRYLAFGRRSGRRIDSHLAHPDVLAVHRLARLVAKETHRLRGLVRFRRLADGLWYAPLAPDSAVLPFLAPYFCKRLQAAHWLLHDCRRGCGVFGQGHRWFLETIESMQPLAYAGEEAACQRLWRTFFSEIAIPERHNPRRQKQFLPMKYWQHLVEMAAPGELR